MVEMPEELKKYGFQIEGKAEVIEQSAVNNLGIMKNQALKLLESYDRYIKCDDERMKDDLLEAMSSRINHIAQAFCDIMAFIEIGLPQSHWLQTVG